MVRPQISVLIVSDYRGGEPKSWASIRRLLSALAHQDGSLRAEFLLCESQALETEIPSDLTAILPSLRIVLGSTSESYGLKNQGVLAASAEIVAVIDADCIPARDWLRRAFDVMQEHDKVAAVSGRTNYAGTRLIERLLALITRSSADAGGRGHVRRIANNNAVYRRSTYLAHPLPTGAGPFVGQLQSDAMLQNGFALFFEPRMQVTHDFEGWAMEQDIRRNIGFSSIFVRLHDHSTPYAWMTSLGYASIPAFLLAKVIRSWSDCLRCRRYFGVRPRELPLAFACAVVVRMLEIPGMTSAFRGRTITATAYR